LTTDAQWRDLYQAAMLELDRTKLQTIIEIASAAMQRRLQELMTKSDPQGDVRQERQEIVDALDGLRSLHRLEFRSSSELSNPRGNAPTSEAL
jgi:hypothetical protein